MPPPYNRPTTNNVKMCERGACKLVPATKKQDAHDEVGARLAASQLVVAVLAAYAER